MVVRIRLRSRGAGAPWKTRIAACLKIIGTVSIVASLWIIAAGLSWAGAFVLQIGLFSHWQVWMALGVAAQLTAFRLNRPNRQLISSD